jgi:hypothetical protein
MAKLSLFGCALTLLALAGAARAQPGSSTPPPARIQTTPEANREGLQGVVQSPLRDLNVVRTKIPLVLLDAMADPYHRPVTKRCIELAALLQPLNDALGADLDAPSVDQDDLLQKGGHEAYGAMATFASSAIPFRGWVRQLSGAEQHDRLVQAAITAGAVRRAYLKGLGEARGCNPPATPSHQLTQARAAAAARPGPSQPPPQSQPKTDLFTPRYPIR